MYERVREMQLDIEETRIDVVESVVYNTATAYAEPVATSVVFVATLEGTSTEGHTIHMNREASSPDAAIRALFEAMTEAGVTL